MVTLSFLACKAVILQFESGSRLQTTKKPLTHRVNGFFVVWAWRSHARLARKPSGGPRRGNPPLIVSMSLISYHPSGQWLFCCLGMAKPCKACPQAFRRTPEGQPASHRIDVPHLISSIGSMAFLLFGHGEAMQGLRSKTSGGPPGGEPASQISAFFVLLPPPPSYT